MPREWIIADVADLPWATHPFRCRWADRFERTAPPGAEAKVCQEGVRDLALALTPKEVAECGYHSTDWHTAADLAVLLVEGGDTSLDAVCRIAEENDLDNETAEALNSFFRDPIFLSGNKLGNGQHRVCALKLAQVPRCPIES